MTCKVKGTKSKPEIKCTVKFTALRGTTRASARLSRGDRTYARGVAYIGDGVASIPLLRRGRIDAGRYMLTLRVRYENGKTATTRRRVDVS